MDYIISYFLQFSIIIVTIRCMEFYDHKELVLPEQRARSYVGYIQPGRVKHSFSGMQRAPRFWRSAMFALAISGVWALQQSVRRVTR